MRRLDLSHTRIKEVPKGIENMVKLTCLDLSYTELAITRELANHRKLKTLRCTFAELNHFSTYVRSLPEGESLTDFDLTTAPNYSFGLSKNSIILVGCNTTVSSESTDFPLPLPKNVKTLQMEDCRINVRSLCELTSIDSITNLQELDISECVGDLMYLFYYSQAIFPILERIELLVLDYLPSLRDLVGIEGEGAQPSLPTKSFSSLRFFSIVECGNIKKIFSLKNASFPNLKYIQIHCCKELEEIVSTTRENEIEEGGAAHYTTTVDVVTLFPKLYELDLWNLPKLQSIPFVADSLKRLKINMCPNLKRIPLLDREPWHPSLQVVDIDMDEESWSSLEWNNLKDKDAYWRELQKIKNDNQWWSRIRLGQPY